MNAQDEKLLIKQIREKAESYRDWTAQNLSQIIKVPAMSNQERDRILFLKELCERIGFDEVRIDGLGNLLARVGSGPQKLVIDAHIDTVGVGDRSQWKRDPFSGDIEGGLVHGRGTSDQTGGAASMLTAGRILKELAYSGAYSVWFVFSIIEEDCDGMCWKYLIEEEHFIPDFFVSTEPTSLRLYRGHRGRMEMEVHLKGVSCHGSAPERGVSAAYKAARAALAIEKLNEELKPDADCFLGKGTVVVSKIDVHGPSQCAVPDQAMLYLDRRLTWGENRDMAIEQVRSAILAAGLDAVEVIMPEYRVHSWTGKEYGQELYFPTWKLQADHPLVQAGSQTYTRLFGVPPEVDKWTFSTNCVAVAGRHDIPCIGFGPGDEAQAHAPNEVTRIDDLWKAAAFYAALPYTLPEVLAQSRT
ncbi:MAG TPA: YgeY family selenium metabolism-linked hydrolase [Treponema sp.]|jgi:putative selenium metabolism hydrolase|nr:YgeY family selenium metabolism-linked hydrolase [Treponema sp.]HON14219.1 YgeY family selenium metabolism-linked hydrolase [Treponema sp.]HPC71507.1 YgeY family selenium metabolism-linked hydrolase [Treponema sp.]HRS04103.1 YgeY family selenium metabolism-linked hydrolase [Treponema sp.]HRU28782.1 YgeY family selenium metabolism-linked hydrolase [Treponema sp.]